MNIDFCSIPKAIVIAIGRCRTGAVDCDFFPIVQAVVVCISIGRIGEVVEDFISVAKTVIISVPVGGICFVVIIPKPMNLLVIPETVAIGICKGRVGSVLKFLEIRQVVFVQISFSILIQVAEIGEFPDIGEIITIGIAIKWDDGFKP